MVKTSLNFDTKCRSCLAEDQEMRPLFSEFDQGLSLSDILKSTTCLEVEEDDGLSSYICENCTTIVVDFFNFKAIYVENNNYIKSLYSKKNAEENEVCEQIEDFKKECATETFKGTWISSLKSDEAKISEIKGEYVEPGEIMQQNSLTENTEICKAVKYYCEECGKYFLLKSEIQEHMVAKHNALICNFDNHVSKADVQIPKVIELEVNNENITLQCETCDDTFKTYAEIEEHYKSHKKYICEHCGAGFLKKSYLNDHIEGHTTERRHMCQICGKAFRRRTVLAKHKKIHTHPRQCVCEICGLRFAHKGTLSTHIKLKHIKERNFNCIICGLWFPLKSTLMKHIYRHNDDRKQEYLCNVCHMGYKDKSSLNRHVIIKHTENASKPCCSFCGKQYTTNTNLLKHVRKHHKSHFKKEFDSIEQMESL